MKCFKLKKLKGENFIMFIYIIFLDGVVKLFDFGVIIFDVVKSISNSLVKKVLVGKFNGVLIDLDCFIVEDGLFEIVIFDYEDVLGILCYLLVYLMVNVLCCFFFNIKFGVGFVIDFGFYYDIDNGEFFVIVEDLFVIEVEMMKIVKENNLIVCKEILCVEVLELFVDDFYKVELIIDLLEDEIIIVYD